jgi:hypothetical protein
MEASILESKDSLSSALIQIAEWFKSEKPMMDFLDSHDEDYG